MNAPPSALRSTFFVSVARVLSMILYLAQGVVSAKYFGASADKDSYLVAQTIPGLLSTLLVGGAYATQLLMLAEIGRDEGVEGQIGFLRTTLRDVALLLLPFALIAIFIPIWMVRPAAPGLEADRLQLSARLVRFTTLTAVSAVGLSLTRCLYEVRLKFALTCFVNLLVPLISLGILIALAGRLGITALAIGPLVGTMLVVVILLALIRRILKDPAGFEARRSTPEVRAARKRSFWLALLPLSFGANYGQINLMIDNAFASYLPIGSISLLGFAFVIVSNAELLTSLSLGEVTFARLAAAAQQGGNALHETVRWSLRHMLLLVAPVAVGLLAFPAPVVRLLFQRGEFGTDATSGVSGLLACYGLKVLFTGYVAVLSQALLARKRIARITWVAAAAIVANACLNGILMRWFGVFGLALATTCVALLHLAILWILVRRDVVDLLTPGEVRFSAKVLACAAAMGLLVHGWALLCETSMDPSTDFQRAAEVATGLALAAVVYVGLLHAAGVEEARQLFRRVLNVLPFMRPA